MQGRREPPVRGEARGSNKGSAFVLRACLSLSGQGTALDRHDSVSDEAPERISLQSPRYQMEGEERFVAEDLPQFDLLGEW